MRTIARDFDGIDDSINFGSAAGIDNRSLITIMLWTQRDDAANVDVWVAKDGFTRWVTSAQDFGTGEKLVWEYQHSVTRGIWRGGTTLGTGLRHIAISYNNGATSNDPNLWVDAAAETVTELGAPVGTPNADAAFDLVSGLDQSFGLDFLDGRLGWLTFHNAILNDAAVNRHKWWGCAPGGPSTMLVWHPMWTSDLVNKGTGTADGTNDGSTMASLPRVERCWAASMGCGR